MLRTISSLLFPSRLRGSAWEGAGCKRHSDARDQSDKCYGLNIGSWVLTVKGLSWAPMLENLVSRSWRI